MRRSTIIMIIVMTLVVSIGSYVILSLPKPPKQIPKVNFTISLKDTTAPKVVYRLRAGTNYINIQGLPKTSTKTKLIHDTLYIIISKE